jgi:hypothetical protein
MELLDNGYKYHVTGGQLIWITHVNFSDLLIMLLLNEWNNLIQNEKSQWGCMKKPSLHPPTDAKEEHKHSWI